MSRIINVNGTSGFVRQFLRASVSGQIHSVYEHTINVVLEGQLLALQSSRSLLSPLSIRLDLTDPEFAGLGPAPGDPCSVYEEGIWLPTGKPSPLSIKLTKDTCVYDPHLPASYPGELSNLTDEILRFLSLVTQGDEVYTIFAGASPEPLLSVVRGRLQQAEAAARNHQWTLCAETLCGLIGLGIGLTPSGDDFLSGVLAALQITKPRHGPLCEALSDTVLASLARTNDISSAFLKCAAGGLFSEAVITLFRSHTGSAIEAACRAFLQIGHSSGLDTLCGITWVLSHVCGNS